MRLTMLSRREMLAGMATAVAFRNETLNLVERAVNSVSTRIDAEDEAFWNQIQQAFTLDRNIVNFNNGGVAPSPRVVQDALRRYLEYSNQAPSYFMWRNLEPEVENVRRRLAQTFGADPEEVAITRNASEALENVLFGLPMSAGDEALTTLADYPRMITTLKQRERRDGIKLVQVPVPTVPQSPRELVRAVEGGITDKTKLILVSQVSFMNGQIFPIRALTDLGRKHGIPVVVDGAHAFCQFPMSRDALGCDYYGTSLHKWLMAPIGTGMLVVRKEKIEGLWPLMAAADTQNKDIRKFEEIGTHPAANHNAIGEALTFHEMIGVERKAARFRYLRSRWANALQEQKNVVFHTNLNPGHSCALTNVEIQGIEPEKLAGWLLDKKGIFVTTVGAPTYKGIRVTPNVYTTLGEIDRFREAMLEAARHGIG